MNYGPDLTRLGEIISAWKRGILTFDEAKARLETLMEPANYLPEIEQGPEPVEVARAEAMGRMARSLRILEQRFTLVIEALGIQLARDFDPKVLVDEAKPLARADRKFDAITLHREMTGAGLAEAKRAVETYMLQCEK